MTPVDPVPPAQPETCPECKHPWHDAGCPVVVGPGETSAAADMLTCGCIEHEYREPAGVPPAARPPQIRRETIERLVGFLEQVAQDGILPSLAWFRETADLLRDDSPHVDYFQRQAEEAKFAYALNEGTKALAEAPARPQPADLPNLPVCATFEGHSICIMLCRHCWHSHAEHLKAQSSNGQESGPSSRQSEFDSQLGYQTRCTPGRGHFMRFTATHVAKCGEQTTYTDRSNSLTAVVRPHPDPLRKLVENLENLPVTARSCPDGSHESHDCNSLPNVNQTAVRLIAGAMRMFLSDPLAAAQASGLVSDK